MLDIRQELSRFSSIDLESIETRIGEIPDDTRKAIELYNRAIEDINCKNEDIAIIALKKAIAIYPAFYEAMNLMGICYLCLDDEENARIMFNKVIQMDDNSIRALNYIEELDNGNQNDTVKKRSKKNKRASKRIRSNKTSSDLAPSLFGWFKSGLSPEKNQPYYFKYILGFVLGVLAMCLLWIFIPNDAPLKINFNKPIDESAQFKKLKDENIILTTQVNEAIKALEKATETETQLRDQMEQYSKWNAILRDLQKLSDEGKHMEVVTEIDKNLAGLDLPKDIEQEIIALNNESKPKAVPKFYDLAAQIYRSNSKAKDPEVYKKSAADYKMAIRIIEEMQLKPSYMTEIYYYGGKAIALSQYPSKEEANAEAIRCFNEVISKAPGSKLASYSEARINELETGQTINH